MKRFRMSYTAIAGGTRLAFGLANNVAEVVDRRMPEARALAEWLDYKRGPLGLPDGANFAGSGKAPLAVATWQRVRTTIAREWRTAPAGAQSMVDQWLDVLTSRIGLDSLAAQLLWLTLAHHLDDRIEFLIEQLSEVRGGRRQLQADPGLIGLLLQAEPDVVERALRPDALLRASGLLQIDRDGNLVGLGRLVRLVRMSVRPGEDPIAQLLGPVQAPTLPWDTFAHLGRPAGLAAELLRAALARREPGINILLYGPPGTGKTSFAATLAAEAGALLRPVSEEDESGHEPTRHERLAGLQLAQRLAVGGQTALLFDEAEDLFIRMSHGEDGPVATSRVFIHRLLERTPVPVIWTANRIEGFGPAILRRMTICLEQKVPDTAVRTRLWRRMAEAEGVSLADADASRLARLLPAAPALAASALRATRLLDGGVETAQLIVEGVARVVGGGRPAATPASAGPYDPALVNADTDLLALADRLAQPGAPRAVSLLLSGPPGTGKSAWVRHLAERMGLEVLQKRASDLVSPFVGVTESNIAEAFAEARDTGAFLIFDEADSLLGDRAMATRSWEISEVNEMLTWMEGHDAPFACTTNLPDRLDPASLRRFLVKLRFDWMTPDQARAAFRCFFGMAPPDGLDALSTSTPADFALVRRRAALEPEPSDAHALVRLLRAESDGRAERREPVGFRPR